jgi:hypothetical protein
MQIEMRYPGCKVTFVLIVLSRLSKFMLLRSVFRIIECLSSSDFFVYRVLFIEFRIPYYRVVCRVPIYSFIKFDYRVPNYPCYRVSYYRISGFCVFKRSSSCRCILESIYCDVIKKDSHIFFEKKKGKVSQLSRHTYLFSARTVL